MDSEQMLRRLAITHIDVYIMCFNVLEVKSLHNIEMKVDMNSESN